jgi:dTDP-4-amino-4,6-dideoxygalactose transaminase
MRQLSLMSADFIPISQISVGPNEEELVLQVLRSGQLAQGPMVAELEEQFARLAGVHHAVGVSSGTTALIISLQTLLRLGHIRDGDEVLTSPFTFVATLNAALQCGLTVRFADIGADFCLDPASVEARLSERTRVLMPVHLYGLPADMQALMPLARERNLAVVEDAAQALGASVHGRPAGSFGLGCFSLYATKNVTAGEGGVVTTSDADCADMLRILRNQGMRDRYKYVSVGTNARMTDLQAAVAVGQLRRFDLISSARCRNARLLTSALEGIPGVILPREPPDRRSAWHQYTIRVTEDAGISRDDIAKGLRDHGIGTGIYYPRPVYDYDCFDGHPQIVRDPTPNATAAADEVLSLPVHPLVGDDGVARIADTLRDLLHA